MMPDNAPLQPPGTQPPETPQAQIPVQKPPELTKTPTKCNACDMMVTLCLLTSSCEGIEDPTKRLKCKELLKPLEEGKDKAVDALANVIVVSGCPIKTDGTRYTLVISSTWKFLVSKN